jgi:release factor glutamine methyltransferase
MLSGSKRVFFEDFVFVVDENVYEPAEDSFLFAKNLNVKEGELVLDMGTGCGILGIIAAREAGSVLALDLSPYAVHCARKNSILNNARSKMNFIQGDLFTSIDGTAKFDIILFNAPYLPTEETEGKSWLERAWAGGASGRRVIDRFISGAPQHLKPNGYVLLMQSTLTNVDETVCKFGEQRMRAWVVGELAVPFFETITLVRAERMQHSD